jgi:hypothetical protein
MERFGEVVLGAERVQIELAAVRCGDKSSPWRSNNKTLQTRCTSKNVSVQVH